MARERITHAHCPPGHPADPLYDLPGVWRCTASWASAHGPFCVAAAEHHAVYLLDFASGAASPYATGTARFRLELRSCHRLASVRSACPPIKVQLKRVLLLSKWMCRIALNKAVGLPGRCLDLDSRLRAQSAVQISTATHAMSLACHPQTSEVVVGGLDGTLAVLACLA